MGSEPVSDLPVGHASPSVRKRDRGPADVSIRGYAFVCAECTPIRLHEDPEYGVVTYAPSRCCLCQKQKYTWSTRKKLEQEIPARVTGKVSLHTYTLGEAQYTKWTSLDSAQGYLKVEQDMDEYWELRGTMKDRFRKFLQSKWWRNRVSGCFYTIEVKATLEWKVEGTSSSPSVYWRYKLHPHVHAIVEHDGVHDFKSAAIERGLGSYTYVRRIRGSQLTRPIRYIMKYAMKDYGNPRLKGRYYERTGCFRKASGAVRP